MVRTVVILYWATIIVGLAVILTQILLPTFTGRPLFPLLRQKRRSLETEAANTREELDTAQIEQEIQSMKKQRRKS